MNYSEWRSAFERAVSIPEAQINLAHAALLLATDEYPDLDVSFYLARLDEMAETLGARITHADTPRAIIAKLNTYLFEEWEFRGNRAEYYDPRNSYLNEVLERRVGLPITLSVLVLAIAQRLNLPIVGVGLPGHFVVKWRDAQNEIVFDPFYGGEILERAQIEQRAREIVNPLISFHASWLDAVGNKYILTRMLHNLKSTFLRMQNIERAWQVIDKLLLLDPRAGDEIRDFGLLSLQLGAFRQAAIALEQYLLAHPDAPDEPQVRVYLNRALQQIERLN